MLARIGKREGPSFVQFFVAAAGALVPGLLYLALPEGLTLGPSWSLLVVMALLLAPSIISIIVFRRRLPYSVLRSLAMAELAVLTAALISSVALLINSLTLQQLKGATLLRDGAILWCCNILIFAVWYWEVDGNGPLRRHAAGHVAMDFQFPQQVGGKPHGWAPTFPDYLFLAFCSATALSPADTMPLTPKAKMLMMTEAIISMLIIVLIIARSVNILS